MNVCSAQENFRKFYKFVESLDKDFTQEQYEYAQSLYGNLNKDFIKERNVNKYFDDCFNALLKKDLFRAKAKVMNLRKLTKPFANDNPVEVGTDAYVKRCEHGWMDCRMKVKVVDRYKNSNGVWSYKCKVYAEDGKTFEKDYYAHVEHTRDLVPC